MGEQSIEIQASAEKNRAALTSVVAAVGLTTFKIIVGVLTGSLGILAEAAHSALDLVAALVTFFAVKISSKAADEKHMYGHGKVENLSALFETLLLLATCVWIIYESVQRFFFKTVAVEINFWSFFVMVTAIIIDYSRSRVLYHAARKHNSQALEADALHFSTDIWSSSVVILGLILVKLSELVPALKFLHKADAVSAFIVALIVIYVSIELGIRTIQGLLDTAPAKSEETIRSIAMSTEGVLDCHKVRVRMSGPTMIADLHVVMDGKMSLEDAHARAGLIKSRIKEKFPGIDVTIHNESASKPEDQPVQE